MKIIRNDSESLVCQYSMSIWGRVGAPLIFGRNEAWVTALSTSLPGIALIAVAWGLRSLLAGEGEEGE